MRFLVSLALLVLLIGSARADTYALVDSANNCTVSFILWDGVAAYTPASGLTVVTQANAPAACPAPAKSPLISAFDFNQRFTFAEKAGFQTSTDHGVKAWLFDFQTLVSAGKQVDLTNPEIKAGLDYLVSLSLLTAPREAAILTP